MLLSPRALILLAAGAVWFLLGGRWPLCLTLGMVHNAVIFLILLDDWRRLRATATFVVQRELREVLALGAPNLVRLTVSNPTRSSFHLEVRDEPPVEFVLDRRDFVVTAEPGATYALSYHVTPPDRGECRFAKINVRFTTPLGLLIRASAFDRPQTVRVYPNLLQTAQHDLLARRNRLRQMGLRQARLHGRGLEFERLREYRSDDDLRRIDWKASARRHELVTREYQIERSQHLLLLLDCGRTMATRPHVPGAGTSAGLTKLDLAINACVMLTYVATQADDRVGLFAFADQPLQFVPPSKGRSQLYRVAGALAGLQPRTTESNYRTAFTLTGSRMRKRGLAVIFTDLLDPDSSERLLANMRLLARKHFVLCVALSDYELDELLAPPPGTVDEVYRQTAAVELRQDRRRALAALRSQGVRVLNATSRDLTVAVVNQYLELKQEGRV